MTNEEIKNEIIGACIEARAQGLSIKDGDFGDGKTCGCPLMLLARKYGPSPEDADHVFAVAKKRYDWDDNEIWSFIDGYDRGRSCRFDPKILKLGIEVREALR